MKKLKFVSNPEKKNLLGERSRRKNHENLNLLWKNLNLLYTNLDKPLV
jgi:hypothetical protein